MSNPIRLESCINCGVSFYTACRRKHIRCPECSREHKRLSGNEYYHREKNSNPLYNRIVDLATKMKRHGIGVHIAIIRNPLDCNDNRMMDRKRLAAEIVNDNIPIGTILADEKPLFIRIISDNKSGLSYELLRPSEITDDLMEG